MGNDVVALVILMILEVLLHRAGKWDTLNIGLRWEELLTHPHLIVVLCGWRGHVDDVAARAWELIIF